MKLNYRLPGNLTSENRFQFGALFVIRLQITKKPLLAERLCSYGRSALLRRAKLNYFFFAFFEASASRAACAAAKRATGTRNGEQLT